MKINNTAPNEYFCLAPWTHTFISPQSERRLCCASREEHTFIHQYIDSSTSTENKPHYNPATLDEHWNSERMRKVRQKMLKGEMPPECIICHKKELTIDPYKDYFTKVLFPHLIDDAINSTDNDGFTTMKPRSYDYRFSNTCNFKCRMCGDLLSSAWEQEKRKHKTWDADSHPWMTAKIGAEIKKFQSDTVKEEFLSAIRKGEVEEIYWVGGEPLAWDFHWQVMQFLVDSDIAKNIIVRYNTNLSQIAWKGRDLFADILPHFKGYTLMASIDGPGKTGEYIRTGLNWDHWVKNLDHALKFVDRKQNRNILLDVTITLPGLFSLKEMFDFALEREVPVDPKLVYAFDPATIMSPLALPREMLNEVVDDLIKYMFPRTTPITIKMLSTVIELKRRKTYQEAYPESWQEGLKAGKKHLRYLEKIRNDQYTMDDAVSSYPKVLDWWQKNES